MLLHTTDCCILHTPYCLLLYSRLYFVLTTYAKRLRQVLCTFLLYPLAYAVPGPDHGSFENPFNTVAMLRHSPAAMSLSLTFCVLVFVLNSFRPGGKSRYSHVAVMMHGARCWPALAGPSSHSVGP